MTIPSGYTALSLVGFTDQGTYDASKTYVANDLVHYKNSIFRALKDDLTGVEPVEGESWAYFVFSPDDVEENTKIASNAAQSALSSARNSEGSAQRSADRATAAAGSVTDAQSAASKAAASATQASGYADSALSAATQAAGYAGEAEYRLMIDPDTGCMALAHYTKEA